MAKAITFENSTKKDQLKKLFTEGTKATMVAVLIAVKQINSSVSK
tara:strand:- start:237 stop:371 length:135 start_codon:yes stop_codon:yes gene_type:complete